MKIIRVSSGSDEVQACMNPEITLLLTHRLLFLPHIDFMLVVNEVNDWHPRVTVVDIVAKSGRVNDSELDLELLLLQLSLDDFNLRELVELFLVATSVVLGRRQLGRKKRVDERCFAQTRLA